MCQNQGKEERVMQLNKKPIVCAVSLALVACLSSGCAAEWEQFKTDIEVAASEASVQQQEYMESCEYVTLVSTGDNSIRYYVDNATDVMYMWRNAGYSGGPTVMLHPDGTPLLYSEWLEMRGES